MQLGKFSKTRCLNLCIEHTGVNTIKKVWSICGNFLFSFGMWMY